MKHHFNADLAFIWNDVMIFGNVWTFYLLDIRKDKVFPKIPILCALMKY